MSDAAHATAEQALGWDAFLQQSIALESATDALESATDAPDGAPFEPLDALPEAELPSGLEVPHDAVMTAVLMPGAVSDEALALMAMAPPCDDGARDLVCALRVSVDELGNRVLDLWLAGAGTVVQQVDASGNVRARVRWRGQEWPVLVVESDYEGAHALTRRMDAMQPGLGAALRAAVGLPLVPPMDGRHGNGAYEGARMMAEVMAMAWSWLMRARLGLTPGLRTPEHQALTRRMWARCLATVRARAEAQVREDALPVPSVAAQLSLLHVAGRTGAVVERSMRQSHRLRPVMRVTADGREVPELVEVTPHLPDGVTEARVGAVLMVEPTLFPNIGPDDDLQALMMEVLVQRLSARNLMRTLGYIALIHERCGVELEGDELPDWLRREVMELTGYPSRAASKSQRTDYRDIAYMVRHYQWLVVAHSTHGGKGKGKPKRRPARVPLLLASALEARTDAAMRLVVNPDVLEGGRTMPIPRTLMAVRDEADPDGSLRMLGVGIVSRLALSGADHARLARGEALVTALARWRLHDTLERLHRKDGAVAAQRWLDGLMDALRTMQPANIIGGTRVEWGKGRAWLSEAQLHYGTEQPGWLRKRPPALPAGGTPSAG